LADALYMIPRAPYDTEGLTTYELFDDALGLVLEATGVRREQLAEICDNGSATDYIARKLEAYEAETDYHFMR
jgi:hypothetical protein